MKRNTYISGILILVILAVFLFFPEISVLQVFEKFNFPSGTLITWIGLISWVYFFYSLGISNSRPESILVSVLKKCFKFLLLTSYLWGFIGYLLANNWSMTFSGSIPTFRGSYNASLVYWGVIYFLVVAPVFLFFVRFILKRLRRL